MELVEFFKENPHINISQFADLCGINKSLMRKYSVGMYKPTQKNKALISKGIETIIEKLLNFKNSMEITLNVGDYVVCTSLGGTHIEQIYCISKVTAKTAQDGVNRFHRAIKYSNVVDPYGEKGSNYRYERISNIEEYAKTPIYKKYIISKIRNRMQERVHESLTVEVLKELSKSLKIDTLWK